MIKVLLLLWLADVVTQLPRLGILLLVTSVLVSVVWVSCLLFARNDLTTERRYGGSSEEVEDVEERIEHLSKWKPHIVKLWIVTIATVVFLALLPSKTTIYVTAGAFAGKTVVDSDFGQQVLDVVSSKMEELSTKLERKTLAKD